MKVFLSSDMEGVAGIVSWPQVLGPGPEYERGRALLLAEVNAAIDGAVEGGATEVVVNDSHWTMQNLDPAELHADATYVSGTHKPLYMMQGLDETFDAAFFVAYHGSIDGPASVLSHTYNPRAVSSVRLDGAPAGEAGINALVAAAFGVPVALVTGDRVTIEEAKGWFPGAELVVVKESIGRMSAGSVHPERARALIQEGARRAIERLGELAPPVVSSPATLEVDLLTSDLAELATMVRGVERSDTRRIRITGAPLEVFRSFAGALAITRQLAAEEGR